MAATPAPLFVDRECEASLATAQTHREASGRVHGSATQTVVGVGASAGGLEALTQLIGALPLKTGMSFVIVQHLAPKRASSLAAILACATKMPVSEVREEPDVEPNHVYVIPPDWDMIIAGGKLRLLPQERRALHHGIDRFFRSLAADCGHQAIGVVLSGNASDGSYGITAIKEAGGITFAQDQSAQHDSMPRNAVASGCVDFVLPPGKIAQEIARISRRLRRTPREKPASTNLPSHAAITRVVHEATGIDFSGYKVKTLQRRIARRMALHKLRTLQAYEKHLKQVPEEAEALSQDILINVTSFFRNPEAFETLEHKVFPTLIARLGREPLRIWTIGCSSGEEAYSLAMLAAECTAAGGSPVPLQLFGTDLNNIGVAKARLGLYPKTIVEGVSPERLKRFFTEENAGYRISKAIREQCVFSRHNVLSDPPFSRVDLISCRNLLIYLEPVLHEQIIPMLHYALKPGGFLWLGSSETITTARSLFDVADAPHKIFLRGVERPPRDRRDHLLSRGETAPSVPGTANGRRLVPGAELRRVAESILLTKYAPPGVVISAGMEIVQFRGATGSFLAPAAGAPSLHLLKMLREGLLVPVRTAILRAAEEGRSVREEGLRIKSEGRSVELALEVIPIKSGAGEDGGFLVLFDEKARLADRAAQAARDTDGGGDELVRAQHELAATREYLQSVIEQQEVANGELQAAVEEAQSANEELQSVNEELETSKEEIQSSNEELATLNDELTHRNLERGRLNESLSLARDYAESIVASVRWPLVVLDAGLRVKTASRAFCEVFHVGSQETEGRLIYDLGNGQWNIPALRTLLEELLPRHDQINDFEVRHNFEQIGPRIMLLNARRLTEGASAENEPLIVLAIEDITTRRGQEELLAARASELLHADRSKDEFLAMLAHELRNPLAPLRNAAEILQTTTATAKQRMEAEDILRRQIENMSRMIDDLLDVARIIEGKIELRKEVVVIQTVLAAAVNVARPAIQARGQELAMSLPEEAIFLHADATRLEQVFGNLLGNACKYSERDGHISVHADRVAGEGRRPAELVVRVCDDGMGIAPELLPHVFELFVQAAHALDRAQGGLGIGLTLVQRLVNLHGGSVSAHSAGLGHGSEFIVRLPILPSPTGVSPIASVHSARDPSRRMLIVDDNEDSARSMSTLQRLRGHETRTVFTGPDAVAAAIEFAPEVVLLDIGLPGMDGYEVARRLRAIPALDGTFLVAMTGYGTDGDRALAKEAGFDEYFVKPVDLDLLRAWLRSRP